MWRNFIIGERFPWRKEKGRDLFILPKETKVFEKGFSLLKSRDDDQKRTPYLLLPQSQQIGFGRTLKPGQSNRLPRPP
jgi:hypothetical protein